MSNGLRQRPCAVLAVGFRNVHAPTANAPTEDAPTEDAQTADGSTGPAPSPRPPIPDAVIQQELARRMAKALNPGGPSSCERILKDVYEIYSNPDVGLIKLGRFFEMDIPPPRRNTTVLVLGSQWSGKSSFINWYIEESLLKTGMSDESQDYTFVVSGKKKETLKGPATMQLYPHLSPIKDSSGFINSLSTEISTSTAKKFSTITFIDSPGLIDGKMKAPFNVNKTLILLGEMADLVIVLFDPSRQTICKRTMDVVEALWASHSEKIRMYVSKSEEDESEENREIVMKRIRKELSKRPGISVSEVDLSNIYVPDISKPSTCDNHINDVCDEIDKAIDDTVAHSLISLQRDIDIIEQSLLVRLEGDAVVRRLNMWTSIKSWSLGFLGIFLPVLLFMTLIVANASLEAMRKHIGSSAVIVRKLISPVASLWVMCPPSYHLQVVTTVICISGALLILSRFFPLEPTLPSRDVKSLKMVKELTQAMAKRKRVMYLEFLRQGLPEEDFKDI